MTIVLTLLVTHHSDVYLQLIFDRVKVNNDNSPLHMSVPDEGYLRKALNWISTF